MKKIITLLFKIIVVGPHAQVIPNGSFIMKKQFCFLLIAMAISQIIKGQTFELVKDINTGVSNSYPRELVEFDNKLYFQAADSNGKELWVTDGSNAGTQMVKDINSVSDSNPFGFTVYNGKIYFAADNGINGYQLWSSDGTSSGTQIVYDVFPKNLFVYNNLLFFTSEMGWYVDLWSTDGTSVGTHKIKTICFSNLTQFQFTEYNGKVYFQTRDTTVGVGTELWTTDGTTIGTYLFKDINPTGNGSPFNFTKFNGKLYFIADDGLTGSQLWLSDGTSLGTQRITNYSNSGITNAARYVQMLLYGGKLYFAASDDSLYNQELWQSDGTASGAHLVKEINPSGASFPNNFIEINGKMFFQANDGTNGSELWITDGTPLGTKLIKDINTLIPDSFNSSFPQCMISYNSKLYCQVSIPADAGYELCESNGSDTGTLIIHPSGLTGFNPMGALAPRNFKVFNGSLYMSANFGSGYELWKLTTTPSSVLEQDILQATKISPNPASNTVTISIDESMINSTATVTDVTGRGIINYKLEMINTPVQTGGLANGIYLVTITGTGGGSATKKLIISK